MVDSGLAEFYNPTHDLKTWLNGAYQQRAMAVFYDDVKKSDDIDPARSSIQSEDLATWGNTAYTTPVSSTLPLK
jgi:hypothetical protein